MLSANKPAAATEKSRGNSAFQEKKWDEAVVLFTNALEFDPTGVICVCVRLCDVCARARFCTLGGCVRLYRFVRVCVYVHDCVFVCACIIPAWSVCIVVYVC